MVEVVRRRVGIDPDDVRVVRGSRVDGGAAVADLGAEVLHPAVGELDAQVRPVRPYVDDRAVAELLRRQPGGRVAYLIRGYAEAGGAASGQICCPVRRPALLAALYSSMIIGMGRLDCTVTTPVRSTMYEP